MVFLWNENGGIWKELDFLRFYQKLFTMPRIHPATYSFFFLFFLFFFFSVLKKKQTVIVLIVKYFCYIICDKKY